MGADQIFHRGFNVQETDFTRSPLVVLIEGLNSYYRVILAPVKQEPTIASSSYTQTPGAKTVCLHANICRQLCCSGMVVSCSLSHRISPCIKNVTVVLAHIGFE